MQTHGSACILEHTACILEHFVCILEHSGTVHYYIDCCKKVEFQIFSCEDAAQQVLMYVCLSVCPWTSWNSASECSRMNEECSRMHTKCSRMFQNACRIFQNACRIFQKFQNAFESFLTKWRCFCACSLKRKFSELFILHPTFISNPLLRALKSILAKILLLVGIACSW